MGIQAVLAGTLLTVLLLFPPVNMGQSEKQLVDERHPVITVDYAVGSNSSSIEAFACLVTMTQVRPNQPRVRGYEVREEEGNVEDGHVLHFPAPT
jgi:hypothetical protein